MSSIGELTHMRVADAPVRAGTAPNPVVIARNLRVEYDGTPALDGLTLSVSPGEVVALLGHSGSGKSTFMKSLTRMAPASADELTVAGRDVLSQQGAGLRALRSEVGHVFQNFNLVPNLSALTNVLTGGLYRAGAANLVGMFTSEQRAEALRLLERVGIEHKAKQQVRTLSGGQQQRVAIARALMQQPKLILADEPVASLDPRLAASVLGLLREIAREQQIPVIMSLHVVALATRFADRVVGLQAGRVVYSGPVDELNDRIVSNIYGEEGEYGA